MLEILLFILLAVLIATIVLLARARPAIQHISDRVASVNVNGVNTGIKLLDSVDYQGVIADLAAIRDRITPAIQNSAAISSKLASLCSNSVIQSAGIC